MALVLVNPHAQGGRVRRRLPALVQALQDLTPLPRWQAPETVEEAIDVLLREPEGARVVLVGGDGTVNRYLPAVVLRRQQLGLVPLGSGNDLARALGLNRRNWRQALADALQGRVRPMDTGLVVWCDTRGDVHRTPFASSLTCGFDAAVGRRALLGPRWLRGLPRYLWATLVECSALQHYNAEGVADGQPLPPGPWLFSSVLNTPTYGSGLPATPRPVSTTAGSTACMPGRLVAWARCACCPRSCAVSTCVTRWCARSRCANCSCKATSPCHWLPTANGWATPRSCA